MTTLHRTVPRRIVWLPRGDELKYLRREGNRMVRARRRRRTAARLSLVVLMWGAGAAAVLTTLVLGARWAVSPGQFGLQTVSVKGASEAIDSEIQSLVEPWRGENLLTLDLNAVEQKLRTHPWIGSSGSVRIQRRLPGSLVVTVDERKAGGLALLDGVVWLLDSNGMPVDRYGPRYARYDFPIIKGLDGMKANAAGTDTPGGGRLAQALSAGVAATRSLAASVPEFYAGISEIDVSDPAMIVLRLDSAEYDLRLSTEDCLRNLENYFSIKEQIKSADGGPIEYVDLRWKDRIAVMPATSQVERAESNGGR